MSRPTARQVWQQLLDEAGEDAIQSVLAMTPEQVEAELEGLGVDLAAERAKADRFLEDLASGALDEAATAGTAPGGRDARSATVAVAQPAAQAPVGRRRRRGATLAIVAATTTAAAAAGVLLSTAHHAPGPSPAGTAPAPAPVPAPAPSSSEAPDAPAPPDDVAAAEWRKKALAACAAKKWSECLDDLDRARALDPAGDDAPAIKAARKKAIDAIVAKDKP
jgi:hypothetical protein